MSPDEKDPKQEQSNDAESQPSAAPETEQEASANVDVQDGSPQFKNLEDGTPKGDPRDIDFLYDVSLDVNVELGRAALKVSDILSLGEGSIVELNRLAGDPVEIIVNNKLVARGEVIVIDENFAVRVTDIVSPAEIISKLDLS